MQADYNSKVAIKLTEYRYSLSLLVLPFLYHSAAAPVTSFDYSSNCPAP